MNILYQIIIHIYYFRFKKFNLKGLKLIRVMSNLTFRLRTVIYVEKDTLLLLQNWLLCIISKIDYCPGSKISKFDMTLHSGFMLALGDFAYYVYKIIHNILIFCTRNILKLVLEFSMHVK